jgi:hypothetical protein
MRYRMEVLYDELVVSNVETDLVLGTVQRHYINDPHNPDRLIVTGCTVLNKNAVKVAAISTTTVPNPLEMAAVAVANHEEHNGYPGFSGGGERPETHRIEWLLGTLLADTASVIARAVIEYGSGGLKDETKQNYSELTAQLYSIWYVSRFGSFDGECRVIEPYFSNAPSCNPRMSFAGAAQLYGMNELSERFPDLEEATLQKVLSWPLELLKRLIDSLLPQYQGETVWRMVCVPPCHL